ncbi:MAG: hypothetical protein KAJ55_07830 [Anaerolineales bacterium]|nr:hypothetical protein [Anaerolineales bacterium]
MAIEVRKPTAHTIHGKSKWWGAAHAYNNPSVPGEDWTCASLVTWGDKYPSITWHTWAAKGQDYVATTLKVLWHTSADVGDDRWDIRYTKDGGNTWFDLLPMGVNRGTKVVASVALDANQDLSLVQIEVNTDKVKSADPVQPQVYDIWTEGVIG